MKATFLLALALSFATMGMAQNLMDVPATPHQQRAGELLQKAGKQRNWAIGVSAFTLVTGAVSYITQTVAYDQRVEEADARYAAQLQAPQYNPYTGAYVVPARAKVKGPQYVPAYALFAVGAVISLSLNISSNSKIVKAGRLLAQ